jgi:hypothetical protein
LRGSSATAEGQPADHDQEDVLREYPLLHSTVALRRVNVNTTDATSGAMCRCETHNAHALRAPKHRGRNRNGRCCYARSGIRARLGEGILVPKGGVNPPTLSRGVGSRVGAGWSGNPVLPVPAHACKIVWERSGVYRAGASLRIESEPYHRKGARERSLTVYDLAVAPPGVPMRNGGMAECHEVAP